MFLDILSAALRMVCFVALFQAAGAAIFIAIFGRSIAHSAVRIQNVGWVASIVAVVSAIVHGSLEAARMAGELTGVFDSSLQRIVLQSTTGTMLILRVAGLLLITVSIRGRRRWHGNVALFGALIAITSFAVMGHTSVHPDRPMLVILLLAHLFAVAFWFGSLAPLYLVSAHDSMRVASEVIDSFSAIALWLVPGLLLVGVLIATLLIPHLTVFRETYGRLLIAKGVGFALLMMLAAANKWRFAPAINRGEVHAIVPFQRSVIIEYGLIVLLLSVTAVLTGFFSPDP
jgi:putative copper resistance protein D